MVGDKRRNKPFHQYSWRHQRRIIQEDVRNIYYQNVQYRRLNSNEMDPHNILHNDARNINSLAYVDEAEQVYVTNNELLARNSKEDLNENSQNYFELLGDNNENNMQLSHSLNNNVEEDKENWEELINDTDECYHYIFDDDVDVNNPSDVDTESKDEKLENITVHLRDWALRNNVSHKAINELLKLLSKYTQNCLLPKDARTVLHTPRVIDYTNIAGGNYVHFGLPNLINLLMEKYTDAGLTINKITLSLNVDGLPISKSSSHCLWPILISDGIFKCVHMVGVYYGASKPTSANDFLGRFIDELQNLIRDGFIYDNRNISITLSTIICDAPAKSFILYTKGHTGFSSCSKCTITGKSVERTTCFPYNQIYNLRTDEDFVQQTDQDYHKGETSLLQIPNIGLVSAVALDYMHLICLGVVKKWLLLLIKGPLTVRIGSVNKSLISERLIALQSSVPKEFSRKPRSLSDIKYWKATELRQFVLYTGPIVLKSVLRQDIYEHFLTLHVATSILISSTLITNDENIKYAEDLLAYFVQGFQILFGKQFVSHNVHNLLHLGNEVRRNGVLDNFSAFPFENFLGGLKKLIRKPENILQQIARRYNERQSTIFQELFVPTCQLKYEHHFGPLLPEFLVTNIIQYKILQTDAYYFNCDDTNNNVLMLDNKTIVRVLNIVKRGTNDIYIIGHKCNIISSIYEKPCSSAILSIFFVVEDNKLIYSCITQIMCKMWTLKKQEINLL